MTEQEYKEKKACLEKELEEAKAKRDKMIEDCKTHDKEQLAISLGVQSLDEFHEAVYDLENEIDSLEYDWDTRDWDSQDWYQWSLIQHNMD